MSVSSDIKEFLRSDELKRKTCCAEAFENGMHGVIYKECCPACRGAFVGGVFAGGGTVTDPTKSFHLDIKADRALAEKVAAILTEEGISPKCCVQKGERLRLYYKDSPSISDFLTFIGASRFALEFMQREVINSVRFEENRKYNAEMANIDRAATAAAEQILSIGKLKSHGVLEGLPPELKETARLREENPELSLAELKELFSPPISKSGLNHRLKRLEEEARRIKADKQ